jgi:hypothetical protein
MASELQPVSAAIHRLNYESVAFDQVVHIRMIKSDHDGRHPGPQRKRSIWPC